VTLIQDLFQSVLQPVYACEKLKIRMRTRGEMRDASILNSLSPVCLSDVLKNATERRNTYLVFQYCRAVVRMNESIPSVEVGRDHPSGPYRQ
jgi:hypothetical protein